MTKQERLDDMYTKTLAQVGNISPEYRQRWYEDLRLQVEYPGEFVAYWDEWLEKGPGGTPKLVRHVLAHSQDFERVYDAVDQQGRAEQDWVVTLVHEDDGTVHL